MNIRRYEPWSLFDLMQRDLTPFMRRTGPSSDADNTAADWVPAVDIIEEKDRFVLKADVPGVDPADIEVSMDAGVLSVSGERHSETSEESDGLKRIERVSGRFYRRFMLPETADAERIAAKSSNGILEVTIPKQPVVQAKRISVEAA
jgi:HSP20 family protein